MCGKRKIHLANVIAFVSCQLMYLYGAHGHIFVNRTGELRHGPNTNFRGYRRDLQSCRDIDIKFPFKGNVRDCDWVRKNRPFRCLISAAREACPLSCRVCEKSAGKPETEEPSTLPSNEPTQEPTPLPTVRPTVSPTKDPSGQPTNAPTLEPTTTPSRSPSILPTSAHTDIPSSALTSSAPTSLPTNISKFSTILQNFINRARTSAGVKEVTRNHSIHEKAKAHAEFMALNQRLEYSNFSGNNESKWIAEIVGYGPTLEDVRIFLMDSPDHRQTILSPRPDSIGVAISKDIDDKFWVCVLLEA